MVIKLPNTWELDYITCPYPVTAFIVCNRIIPISTLQARPERCPGCGRGI